MITVGVDAHKDTHTLGALDQTGRSRGTLCVPARTRGHTEAIAWATALAAEHGDGQLRWGVEDCRHVTGLLERDLIAAGQHVVRVPTVLSSGYRRSTSRTRGKSDPIDAAAIARATQSEQHLPVVTEQFLDQDIAVLREISRARGQLVRDRTRQINRLIGDLHRYNPDLAAGHLGTLKAIDALRGKLRRRTADDAGREMLRELLLEALTALRVLNVRINDLECQMRHHPVIVASPLLGIPGCGEVTAAQILSTISPISSYRSVHAFTSAASVVPIPIASGRSQSMRVNTGGNRRLNAAFWTIAEYQSRHQGTRGYDLYQAARTRGKSEKSALRIVRCNITKYAYRLLKNHAPLT